MYSGWVGSLHRASVQNTRAKLVGHNMDQAIVQQGYIRLGETTGLEYKEYGLVMYCVECIFYVKVQNNEEIRLQLPLMMHYIVKPRQLTLGAPTSSKCFLCLITGN